MHIRAVVSAVVVLTCAVLVAPHALAQKVPDFSGRWVQVTPAAADEGGGQEQVITQTPTTITTEHPSEAGSHRQVYTLNSESTSQVGAAKTEVVSRTSWDGQKLVISSTVRNPDNTRQTSKQTWSLGADGLLTIDGSMDTHDGQHRSFKVVYKRR